MDYCIEIGGGGGGGGGGGADILFPIGGGGGGGGGGMDIPPVLRINRRNSSRNRKGIDISSVYSHEILVC